MSGHNRWTQIKHKKGASDVKRGNLFGKLLKAVSIAAKPGSETSVASQSVPQSGTSRSSTSWKTEPNPQFNPRLRSAIEKAKENNVPQENIDRAVSKAAEEKNLEEVIIEAYGPEGSALIIEGITDNTNRTVSEIKHILSKNNGKMANPGSVLWSFDKTESGWQPKFKQDISAGAKETLKKLLEALEEHDDVQKIIINASDLY